MNDKSTIQPQDSFSVFLDVFHSNDMMPETNFVGIPNKEAPHARLSIFNCGLCEFILRREREFEQSDIKKKRTNL
jgi:hypothetical protein